MDITFGFSFIYGLPLMFKKPPQSLVGYWFSGVHKDRIDKVHSLKDHQLIVAGGFGFNITQNIPINGNPVLNMIMSDMYELPKMDMYKRCARAEYQTPDKFKIEIISEIGYVDIPKYPIPLFIPYSNIAIMPKHDLSKKKPLIMFVAPAKVRLKGPTNPDEAKASEEKRLEEEKEQQAAIKKKGRRAFSKNPPPHPNIPKVEDTDEEVVDDVEPPKVPTMEEQIQKYLEMGGKEEYIFKPPTDPDNVKIPDENVFVPMPQAEKLVLSKENKKTMDDNYFIGQIYIAYR